MNKVNVILTSTSEFATKCATYCSKNCAIKKTFHSWKSGKKGKLKMYFYCLIFRSFFEMLLKNSLAVEGTYLGLFPSYLRHS